VKIKRKVTKVPAAKKDASATGAPAQRKKTQFRAVGDVIRIDTIPYHFWKEWNRARERNDYLFMFDMTGKESPARAAFGERESFQDLCKRKLRPVPGLVEAELRKIRLEGENVAHVYSVRGYRERERRTYTVERWYLLRGPGGWRIHAIDEISRPKTTPLSPILVDEFPEVVHPDWFAEFDAEHSAAILAKRAKAARARELRLLADKSKSDVSPIDDTGGELATGPGIATVSGLPHEAPAQLAPEEGSPESAPTPSDAPSTDEA